MPGMSATRGRYTDETFILKAFRYDEDGNREVYWEEHPVRENDDVEAIREKVNGVQGYLRNKRGFKNVFVIHGYTMHWDGEKLADSSLLDQEPF